MSAIPARLHPRQRIDIAPALLARALGWCVRPPRHAHATLEARLGDDALVTLSVRSAFDAMLTACAFEAGSEVLLSGFTIPDMVRLVRAHGLVPVPLDCDAATLCPTVDAVERAITPRTRALVVARLFGGRPELATTFALARRRGLLTVDDNAQGFTGLDALRAAPDADVTFHSFGTIKTATALGGAVTRVTDAKLREAMRAVMATWPAQSPARYAKKVATWLALVAPRDPARYAALAKAIVRSGRDLDATMMGLSRGFHAPTAEALVTALRVRPCEALAATLDAQLHTDHGARIARRAEAGERLAQQLSGHVTVLGHAMPRRTHWLFAMLVRDPDGLVRALRAAGFDGARGTSSLTAVPEAPERAGLRAATCASWAERVVFVPAYPEIPVEDRDRLAATVRTHAGVDRGDAVTMMRPCEEP